MDELVVKSLDTLQQISLEREPLYLVLRYVYISSWRPMAPATYFFTLRALRSPSLTRSLTPTVILTNCLNQPWDQCDPASRPLCNSRTKLERQTHVFIVTVVRCCSSGLSAILFWCRPTRTYRQQPLCRLSPATHLACLFSRAVMIIAAL
jgi:hypothetical protein